MVNKFHKPIYKAFFEAQFKKTETWKNKLGFWSFIKQH